MILFKEKACFSISIRMSPSERQLCACWVWGGLYAVSKTNLDLGRSHSTYPETPGLTEVCEGYLLYLIEYMDVFYLEGSLHLRFVSLTTFCFLSFCVLVVGLLGRMC